MRSLVKRKNIILLICLLLLIGYILAITFFVSKREDMGAFEGVTVKVVNPTPLFVKEDEILALFEKVRTQPDSLKKWKLEKEVQKNKYVQEVQIYNTVDKHYVVEIVQRKPFLRIEATNDSYFLDKNGVRLPTGSRYATNVHLYRGHITEMFAKEKLLKFQQFLNENSYWAEMIDYVAVDNEKELDIYLRLKSAKIKFGIVQNIEKKLHNLQVFIDKVGKYKGLETYKSIDLRFDNQIVCEKK